jgi:hypothetical protein
MFILFIKKIYIICALATTFVIIPGILSPLVLLHQIFHIEQSSYLNWCCRLFMRLFNASHVYHTQSHPFIEKGILLANHRSWTDVSCETYYGKSSLVGLNYAYAIQCFYGFIGYIENRFIPISVSDKRHNVFNRILYYINTLSIPRVTYYPEGERLHHQHIKDETDAKTYIKPGLLKSIYEYNKYPVQIMITNNKEKLLNEKTLTCKFGLTLTSYISQPIQPSDYKTFEEFYDAIAKEWYISWYKVYIKSADNTSKFQSPASA